MKTKTLVLHRTWVLRWTMIIFLGGLLSLLIVMPVWADNESPDPLLGQDLMGDMDQDGRITIEDSILLTGYLEDADAPPGLVLLADVSGNGVLNQIDVDLIRLFALDAINRWPIRYGDVNGDQAITVADAWQVATAGFRRKDMSYTEKTLADVNADGSVGGKDAILIMRFVWGFSESFPVDPIAKPPTPLPASNEPVPFTPEPQADLMIENLRIELDTGTGCSTPESRLGTRVWVRNQGLGRTEAFVVSVNGVEQRAWNGLEAGQTTALWFDGYVQNTVTEAVVDVHNEVLESDEGNNLRSEQLPIPTLTPPCFETITPTATATPTEDLTPSITPTHTTTPTPTAGLRVQGYVRENGVMGLANVRIYAKYGEGEEASHLIATTNADGYYVYWQAIPGMTIFAERDGYSFSPCSYRYSYTNADGFYDFVATRISITRTPTATATTSMPDLVIDSMRVELETGGGCYNPPPILGTRVTVANRGFASAGSFTISINGTLVHSNTFVTSGGTVTVWVEGYSQNETVAIVDLYDDVTESDESNNTRRERLPIPTLPPPCKTATPTATATPTVGFADD